MGCCHAATPPFFLQKYVAVTERMFYNNPIENKLFALELRKRGSFYILKAKGDSMVDAGIESGDTLIIRKNAEPKLGDIVVALDENNENTLKRYAGIDKESNKVVFEYMNQEVYPDKKILVSTLICQGVLSHVIKTM